MAAATPVAQVAATTTTATREEILQLHQNDGLSTTSATASTGPATCKDVSPNACGTSMMRTVPAAAAARMTTSPSPPLMVSGSADFSCSQCPARVYRSHAALSQHRRTIHGLLQDNINRAVPCQEPSCSKLLKTVSELRSHLARDHGLHLKKIDSEFPNMKAFTRWKTKIESSECVCFISKKSKILPLERQHYFYCQRSWACRNSTPGGRGTYSSLAAMKSADRNSSGYRRASNAMQTSGAFHAVEQTFGATARNRRGDGEEMSNATIHQLLHEKDRGYVHCTAQLTAKEDLRTGRVSVTGCLTHYAHSMTSRHFVEAIYRRSRAARPKEGGVAGLETVDISSVEERLLAIYELAATKKMQKSVDKIQAALQDLYDCLKDYDEDDETLPGLEETRAWRRSAAQEEAERERNCRTQNEMAVTVDGRSTSSSGHPAATACVAASVAAAATVAAAAGTSPTSTDRLSGLGLNESSMPRTPGGSPADLGRPLLSRATSTSSARRCGVVVDFTAAPQSSSSSSSPVTPQPIEPASRSTATSAAASATVSPTVAAAATSTTPATAILNATTAGPAAVVPIAAAAAAGVSRGEPKSASPARTSIVGGVGASRPESAAQPTNGQSLWTFQGGHGAALGVVVTTIAHG